MADTQSEIGSPPSGGTAVATGFPDDLKALGDQIAGLTLKQASGLLEVLAEHGIEPSSGGGHGGSPTLIPLDGKVDIVEEQTTWNVILVDAGPTRINVIKEVRTLTGLGLKEAKELVDGLPKPIKENATKEEVAKIKAAIEAAGGKIETK